MEILINVAPLLAIALLFYFLLIRPQTRRQRELAAMQQSLTVGDRVMLTSGIHATVTAVHEDTAQLQIADGVVITTALGAVGALLQDDPPHEPNPTTQTEDDA